VSLYKQKASEVWWSDLRHAGQRVRQSTGETDRAKAQKRENEFQVTLWQHVPNIKGRTWGQAVSAWLDAEDRSESELLSLAKFGRLYPDRALHDVTRDSVHEALSFCKTAGTYTRYRSMIAAILNLAKVAGWLQAPPLLASKRDKKKKPRDWLTPEQWAVLRLELPIHLRVAATFAIETGLRQENVLGLRWDKVSIERRLVWVEAEDTKADNAIAVPLSDAALAVLEYQRAAPPYRSAKGAVSAASPFVFTFRGKRIFDVKTSFMAACIRAGVGTYETEDGNYEGFTWHGFRHTWATWHAQNGTPMEVLQKLGAWTDPRMVQLYAHHSPGHLASYANNNRTEK
jgi:integrase